MEKASKIWIDGKIVDWDEAKIHVLTHGLHYGTAIFEGLRCYMTENGPAIFRLDDHVRRLVNSARIYVMDLGYGVEEIAEAIKSTVVANKLDHCYIRPIHSTGMGKWVLTPFRIR